MPPGDVADPLLPPTSGVAFTTATSPKRLQACQHLPAPSMSTEEPKQNHLRRMPPHDCCQHPAVRLQRFDCTTAYHRTCSGLSRDAANTVTNTGHWTCPRCLATAAPAQPLTRRYISEPKHHQCRQLLGILQWNADGLVTKQHELKLRLNDDSIDICLIQEAKLLPRDTTPSFPGFCAIHADRPTNQRGRGLHTLI